MIIHKIAVGNLNEAYVENNLDESLNIISSDDNNRGKTIIIQSLMYCLGNAPVFPATFGYKDYYYIVEFEENKKNYIISRFQDDFIIHDEKGIMLFDGVSELKRYWTKNIFEYPNILKNNVYRICDPELFLQLFFVGQDKKDTDNISNKGFYNKNDFLNMLFSYTKLGVKGMSDDELSLSKNKIRNLKMEKKTLLQKHKVLNSKDIATNYISQHSDKVALEEKFKNIDAIKNIITDLRNSRNKAINKKIKYEIILKELRSLNHTVSVGELNCMDCGSNRISYSTSSNKEAYTFDVSTPDIRNQIIESIKEKISVSEEETDRLTVEININQQKLQKILENEDVSIESILMHKKEIIDANGVEEKLIEIEKEINEINNNIKANDENTSLQLQKQENLLSDLVNEMNIAYKLIDPNGTLLFEELFTKKGETYSGSESTEFHLVKLYSFAKILKHNFPIIVDSFRAEDLSTDREKVVLNLFQNLDNQIIFTTTLKSQELGKYDNLRGINHIDYSNNRPSHILSKEYIKEFLQFADSLKINLQ